MTSGPEGLAPPLTPAAHRWRRSRERVTQSAGSGPKGSWVGQCAGLGVFFFCSVYRSVCQRNFVMSYHYIFFLVGTDIGYTYFNSDTMLYSFAWFFFALLVSIDCQSKVSWNYSLSVKSFYNFRLPLLGFLGICSFSHYYNYSLII